MNHHRRHRHPFIQLAILTVFGFVLAGGAWGQSRIPAEPNNYLQVVSQLADGARDGVQTVFFEVPDTVSGTVFFAIRNPGNDNVAPNTRATVLDTTYYLIGGSGALSAPSSRQDWYTGGEIASNNHLTGTTLATYRWNGDTPVNIAPWTTPAHSTDWVYFPGVNVSEGEHIGNRYYFKVVVEHTLGAGTNKNAFQLAASISNASSTTLVQPAGVRAFAYSWNLGLLDGTATWDLYPFVPEATVGPLVYWNYDMDAGELPNATRINGDDPVGKAGITRTEGGSGITPGGYNVRVSGGAGSDPALDGAWTSFAWNTGAGGYDDSATRNGTWRLRITENGGGPAQNTSEFWFTDSTTQNAG